MGTKKSNTKEAVKEPEQKPDTKTEKKESQKTNSNKPKKGLIIGLIVVAVLVIVGAVIALLNSNRTNSSDPTAKITYSKSFFIYDDGRYTLWNADGKRITEDEYGNQSNFVGGYAFVKKDDQYGVIRDDGKMSIEYGKYGNIVTKGGLYLVQDGNTKEYYLVTGSGKELAKGADLKVYTANSTSGLAAAEVDGKIKIYNYAGSIMAEVDMVEEASEPVLSSSHDFGLFYYNNQNIIFDVRTGKAIATIDGSRYTFDSVSDSRKMIILEDYDNANKYKLIADEKVYNLDETKYYGITALDSVIGYDNYSEIALLGDDYKVIKRVSTYLDLKDSNNYAVENENGNVEIYRNGEMIKDFGDNSGIATSGVLYDDYYAIEKDDKFMFYNLDGSVGINREFNDIYSLFDQFHHAIVADNENEYYLIDTGGNHVGDFVAKSILSRDGGYELKNSEGKYAVADKNGKPVTDFKYESTYYRSNAEPHNIWTGRTSTDSYDVIDVDNGKVVVENVNAESFYDNYFTVENGDGKTEYYTYAGELFYTSEK